MVRGSQKHLLDLLDCKDYVDKMNALLGDAGVLLGPEDIRRPLGHNDKKEWCITEFTKKFCAGLFRFEELRTWWPSRPATPPQWDVISTCTVSGERGLLLIEAKAHEEELMWDGKVLQRTASADSKRNHAKITGCIDEARAGLNEMAPGIFDIRVDSHYQLANRVAHLWKLASSGLPTVLLYLGFIGDTYFQDHLTDPDHWQRVMGGYMQDVVPESFPGRQIRYEHGGSALMLVKSLPIIEASP